LIAPQRKALLPFILRASFCGRFPGRWDDSATEAGVAWGIVQRFLAEKKVLE
jgi:nitric oxide reductase NorQ protein